MPTPAERQALLFLALVTAGGLVVRRVDARRPGPDAEARRALAEQLALVDSAIAARGGGARSGPSTGRATSRPPVPIGGSRAGVAQPASPQVLVDVDVADAAALEGLPWVGPALAARILEDRQAHGAFGSLAGLQRVRGIGPGLTARLAGRVTFSGAPRPPWAAPRSAERRGSP